MPKAALVILPHCILRDVSPLLEQLQQREWRLRVLTPDGRPVTTAEGIRIQADAGLLDAVPPDLRLCVIPGGHYTPEAWEDLRLHRFLRQYDGRRGWVAASCEGVVCLAASGLMGGIMYSAPKPMQTTYELLLRHAIYQPTPVTVDGNVVSSDGTHGDLWSDTIFERIDLV